MLAQLDPAIFDAQVIQARGNLENAEANVANLQASMAAMQAAIQTNRANISPVNHAKQEILLMAPTEVTQAMQITPQTLFYDEQGRALKFNDLLAGDSVYVVSKPSREGAVEAVRVQKGVMTPQVRRERYLSGVSE